MTFKTAYELQKEYEALRAREVRERATRRQEGEPVPEKVQMLAEELAAESRRLEEETRAQLYADRQARCRERAMEEYDRLGLQRPPAREDGLVASPALLMSLGARIEEIHGRRVLTLPSRGLAQDLCLKEIGR
jgi:hypothetical protein